MIIPLNRPSIFPPLPIFIPLSSTFLSPRSILLWFHSLSSPLSTCPFHLSIFEIIFDLPGLPHSLPLPETWARSFPTILYSLFYYECTSIQAVKPILEPCFLKMSDGVRMKPWASEPGLGPLLQYAFTGWTPCYTTRRSVCFLSLHMLLSCRLCTSTVPTP